MQPVRRAFQGRPVTMNENTNVVMRLSESQVQEDGHRSQTRRNVKMASRELEPLRSKVQKKSRALIW